MDVRLLLAINDVLGDQASNVASSLGTERVVKVGTEIRQSIIDVAATKTSSTGRPIPTLSGAAKDGATMAAIGGGAKSAGGGGMSAGERVLSDASLKARLATVGISGAAVVLEIAARYAVRVARDRRATLRADDELETD